MKIHLGRGPVCSPLSTSTPPVKARVLHPKRNIGDAPVHNITCQTSISKIILQILIIYFSLAKEQRQKRLPCSTHRSLRIPTTRFVASDPANHHSGCYTTFTYIFSDRGRPRNRKSRANLSKSLKRIRPDRQLEKKTAEKT